MMISDIKHISLWMWPFPLTVPYYIYIYSHTCWGAINQNNIPIFRYLFVMAWSASPQACYTFFVWLFVLGMKACGGHQLRVVEQTSPTHLGLSQPKRESLRVGSTQERPHHQSQRPQQPSTLFLLDSPGCHLETFPHNPAVQSHLTLSCPVCTFLF